ncbi:MAG: VOC family protein [Opitutales bacterium]
MGTKRLAPTGHGKAWLEDPNGVRIELHQYNPDCCQLLPRTCVVDW